MNRHYHYACFFRPGDEIRPHRCDGQSVQSIGITYMVSDESPDIYVSMLAESKQHFILYVESIRKELENFYVTYGVELQREYWTRYYYDYNGTYLSSQTHRLPQGRSRSVETHERPGGDPEYCVLLRTEGISNESCREEADSIIQQHLQERDM